MSRESATLCRESKLLRTERPSFPASLACGKARAYLVREEANAARCQLSFGAKSSGTIARSDLFFHAGARRIQGGYGCGAVEPYPVGGPWVFRVARGIRRP